MLTICATFVACMIDRGVETHLFAVNGSDKAATIAVYGVEYPNQYSVWVLPAGDTCPIGRYGGEGGELDLRDALGDSVRISFPDSTSVTYYFRPSSDPHFTGTENNIYNVGNWVIAGWNDDEERNAYYTIR